MANRNYGVIRSAEKFEAFAERIVHAGLPFGFDIESGYTGPNREGTSLQPFHPLWLLAGFSFTNSVEWARYVPIAHDNGDNIDDVRRAARGLWLMLQTGLGVAHNLPFEMKGLGRWFREILSDDPILGNQVRSSEGMFPYRSDTIIETFLTGKYSPLTVGQDLKSLTLHVFGHQMIKFAELFPDLPAGKVKQARFNSLELTPQVVTYACEDSVWCLAHHLHDDHYAAVKDTLIYKTEMALVPILVGMEREGLYLDWAQISAKAAEVHALQVKFNEEIQRNLSERLGEIVNINLGSVPQLSEILFERLKLPVKKRSPKTNKPSTDEKALGSIAKADPIVRKILQYREIVKLYGSYLHKYEVELNYAGNGRAYPNHKQTGAGTGRMSVDGVSYQQWPKPYHYELEDGTTFDLNFQNLLISPPEYRIIGFDYSQVELRILAGQANETAMLRAFRDGVDIHRATASTMMKIPLDQVTKKDRSKGKTLNFATVYGSGAENIAEMLTSPDDPVTTEDAEELLAKYFAAFPRLRAWMDAKIIEGRQQGYVVNLFGRKFTVWEYTSPNGYIRSKGDRMCVNAPVQGGAADYCKIAMVRAHKALERAGLLDKVRMVMMIHDAVEFYVHESVDTQTVLDVLGPAVSFPVPGLPEIRADWHEGTRWGEVAEIKVDAAGQIIGYGIEDVDQEFAALADAYAYFDAHRVNEKATVTVPVAPEPEEAQRAPEAPQHAVVTLSQMPDPNQWHLFREYVRRHSGDGRGSMTMVTPEGSMEFSGVWLVPADQPAISALLGGATLTFADEGVFSLEGVL